MKDFLFLHKIDKNKAKYNFLCLVVIQSSPKTLYLPQACCQLFVIDKIVLLQTQFAKCFPICKS